MKRTRLTSALLTASVLLSTTTTATFAGHRGGNGGGGNSFKGNGGGTQMMRSNGNNSFGGQFKQNVGNNYVQKQQFTQKFVPTVKPHANGTITNNLGNIKTFPSNHVITGKNLGTDLKVKLPQTFPSSPNGPTFPGTKVGGIKINDTIKTGPFFPSPTGGVKVPGGPILPPGGSGGGSGSGSGGGSGGGSGSGSGGGSGSGSGSGGGKGNCHNNSCHGNWWYPLGWGWNNSYTGYCGGCYNTGYCGTGYYGSNFCGTYGPAVYSTPVVVNPAPVSVSTPVIVNVKEAEAATTVTAAQATPTTSSTPELIEMTLGQTYALQGPGLGNDAGQVMLEVSDIALGVKAEEWTDAKVGFTLPMFGMSKPTTAKLHLVSSEGKLLRSAEVRLVLPTATTAQK